MGLKWSSAKRGRGKNQNGEDHFSQTQEILVEGLATESVSEKASDGETSALQCRGASVGQ
jgi:hypothetical protein